MRCGKKEETQRTVGFREERYTILPESVVASRGCHGRFPNENARDDLLVEPLLRKKGLRVGEGLEESKDGAGGGGGHGSGGGAAADEEKQRGVGGGDGGEDEPVA